MYGSTPSKRRVLGTTMASGKVQKVGVRHLLAEQSLSKGDGGNKKQGPASSAVYSLPKDGRRVKTPANALKPSMQRSHC